MTGIKHDRQKVTAINKEHDRNAFRKKEAVSSSGDKRALMVVKAPDHGKKDDLNSFTKTREQIHRHSRGARGTYDVDVNLSDKE